MNIPLFSEAGLKASSNYSSSWNEEEYAVCPNCGSTDIDLYSALGVLIYGSTMENMNADIPKPLNTKQHLFLYLLTGPIIWIVVPIMHLLKAWLTLFVWIYNKLGD